MSLIGGRTTGALGLSLSAMSCGMSVSTSLGECSASSSSQSKSARPRISVVIGFAREDQQPMRRWPARTPRRNVLKNSKNFLRVDGPARVMMAGVAKESAETTASVALYLNRRLRSPGNPRFKYSKLSCTLIVDYGTAFMGRASGRIHFGV